MPRLIKRRPLPADHDLPPGLHPVLARLYAARGVVSPGELEPSLARLHSWESMGGIERACDLLHGALSRNEILAVVGDFDADGATSTALAVRALRAFGAARVEFVVPNRSAGHGLSPETARQAAELGARLLITVDTGITCHEGVAAARSLGLKVIVTDHHLPGERLPEADAIIDPNQPECDFPSKALAGVGVIFYLMSALRVRLRERGWFNTRPEPNLGELLDLVAVGTVADLASLDRCNRILVEQGLRRLRAGRGSVGLNALMEVSGCRVQELRSSDLAFSIAPRLNAAGRLADMSIGIRCLITDDREEARRLAVELDILNAERRAIEAEMREQAFDLLDAVTLVEGPSASICLYDPSWHEGVIGILAGRIKERLRKPVILFARMENGELRGSARSVEQLHIRDALAAVATAHPGLILRFGGHARAAGLTIREESLEHFRKAFDDLVGASGLETAEAVLWSDGELQPGEATLELAELLRLSGPWGQGFPEPLFDGEFEVEAAKVVGERHLRLLLKWPGSGRRMEAIQFGGAEGWSPSARARVAYRLEVNDFRGARSPQFIIEHLVPL